MRRRFQIRLRTLLIFVFVLCLPLAWLANRLMRTKPQREAAAQLLRHGYGVMQEPLPGERLLTGVIGFPKVMELRGYLRDVKYVSSRGAGDGELAAVSALTHLRRISLAGDKETDSVLQYIQPCTEVTEVSIMNSAITDAGLEQLRPLHQIRSLNLGHNHGITDAGLAQLAPLRHLQSLGLAYNRGITDAGLDVLGEFPDLVELNVQGTSITDAGLAKLQRLRGLKSLHLYDTAVTDAGLVYLQQVTSLEFVQVGKRGFTVAGFTKLQKALPNCKIYQFGGRGLIWPGGDLKGAPGH